MVSPLASASASPPSLGAVDALILCALQDELEAVLAVGESGPASWAQHQDAMGFRCYLRTFDNGRGGQLRIAAAWTGEMGRLAAANRAQQLIHELEPACLAMCGICAGDRRKVALGDVIVADQLYSYDEGKVEAVDGKPHHIWHSLRTFDLAATWKMDAAFLARELDLSRLQAARPLSRAAQRRWLLGSLLKHQDAGDVAPVMHPDRKARCPDWTDVIREVQRAGLVAVERGNLSLTVHGRERACEDQLLYPDGLPEDPPLRVHVGAIATGAAVQDDPTLFNRVRRVVRTTLGVEMEGAAIGEAAARFARPAIVVKAVSDHADHEKDDSFRNFSCRASAEVLFAFLLKYLDPGERPSPRVLVAGPWFGVPNELRPELERIWKEEPAEKAIARIRTKIRHAEVWRAQIAAVLRYDVILDLSPWRAFASRWSLGLRDVEQESTAEGPSAPLLYLVIPEGELPDLDRGLPPRVVGRLDALRSQEPPFATLAQRIYQLSGAGIALAGFSSRTSKWCRALFNMWPARFIGEPGLGEGPSGRFVESSELLDLSIREPSLEDYLHALRVTAGQVTLAGETQPQPIRDVYVDLELQRERKEVQFQRSDEGDRATSEALREEIEARRRAAWDIPGSEVLPASAIHEVARRILLWGPAGTGKSTLLRFLACRVADEGRIPLWLPRIVDLGEDPAEVLVARALEAVGLSNGPSPARTELRKAVQEGRAFLFLDGFDEAPPAVRRGLPEQVRAMHPEIRLVIASRPLHRMHTGLEEITLTGLPVTGAEHMLRAYYKNDDWIESLLRVLDALPDGMAWMRNPVLLGLAASIYRREGALPDATLEMYRLVIEHLLTRRPWPAEEVLRALRLQARRMLLPEAGEATVAVRESDLPYLHREAMLASGLFMGDEWLRFSHLTLGEYLAAGAGDFSLAEHRRRERERPEGRPEEETALDVLAMAHALDAEDKALAAALLDARDDTPGHRMLRLVLRSVGYGGGAVPQFCARHGEELLELLAARLQAPSGRFGDFERILLEDSERALHVLRPYMEGEPGKRIEARLTAVMATYGEAGTETHIALWNLGIRKPERRTSRWWPTVVRQARAMVRAGLGVDELFELTEGPEREQRHVAVQVLASHHQEFWRQLRPLFNDGDMWIRQTMSRRLATVPIAQPYIREQLHDDESIVRRLAARALMADDEHLVANFDRLLALIDDPDPSIRAYAIRSLKEDDRARSRIRESLRRNVDSPQHFALDESVIALADDLESQPLIRRLLMSPQPHLSAAFSHLANNSTWLPILRERLSRREPETAVIRALRQDVDSRQRIRELLSHEDRRVRAAAVEALSGDRESRDRIIVLFQDDTDPWVQSSCIFALSDDLASLPRIASILSEGESHNLRLAAIQALAKHPAVTRDELWKYFDQTREQPEYGHINHAILRSQVVRALGDDPGSRPNIEDALTDPHVTVREAAIEVLAKDASAREKLRPYLTDPKYSVRTAARLALWNDGSVRDRAVLDLRTDEELVCIIGLSLLVRRADERQRLQSILANGPQRRRPVVVQPLAHDLQSRDLLLECLGDHDEWVRRMAVHVLRRIPAARRRLRALFEQTPDAELHPLARFSWDDSLEILKDDPDAHPILLARARACSDENIVARLIPALANYPMAESFLREQLSAPGPNPSVRAAAIRALAGKKDLRGVFVSLLEDQDKGVRASAVMALAADAEAMEDADVKYRLRELLSHDPWATVRRSSLNALGRDQATLAVVRERVDIDDDDDVRTTMVGLLAGDPKAVPLLRKRLSDRSSQTRLAAANALRHSPLPPGPPLEGRLRPLESLPSLRVALHLGGVAEPPGTSFSNTSFVTLRDRLEAFGRAPRPLNIDAEPDFAEVLLGYLCARLCWASEDGNFANGRVFGEVHQDVGRLLELKQPLIIRVAMDSSDLPRERFLHPSHNLVEAWHIAAHLSAKQPPAILVACADVPFEHLTAPGAAPNLTPGEVYWGPGFFGFRLGQAKTGGLDPMEWLVSSEAREVWLGLGPDDPVRASYLETLSRLAASPSLDIWAVMPVLERVGDLLPVSLRAAFARRLPQSMAQSLQSLGRVTRNLLGVEASSAAFIDETSSAATTSTAQTRLQMALEEVRATLRADGPVDIAIEAFEATVPILSGNEVSRADRDTAVMLLGGLRSRLSNAEQARRLLAIAATIDDVKLSRGARRGLHDLLSWLRTWRIT